MYTSAAEKVFSQVVPEALGQAAERERQRIIDRAFKCAWENCGAKEGGAFTQDHVNRLTDLLIEGIMPFLLPRNNE